MLEDEPTRPSRLSAEQTLDPSWAATRRRLQGDLDNILLKALEKAPERRYASVDALAADIRNVLAERPVSARPASWAYVASRFVRRNRLGVAGVAVALAGLVIGLAAALVQAERATAARRAADEQLASVKALVRGLVLRYSYGVWLTPKGGKLMQAFVEDAMPRMESALAAAPQDMELAAIAADLYSRLAEMLGSYSVATPAGAVTAQRAAERAVALGEAAMQSHRSDGAFVARIATAHMTLATLAQQAGQPADGVGHLQAALRDVDAALPLAQRDAAGRAFLRGARGSIFMRWGQLNDHGSNAGLNKPADALAMFDHALAEFDIFLADKPGIAAITAAAPEDDIDTEASVLQAVGATRVSMAMVRLKQGELAPAQQDAQRGMAIYQGIVDKFPPNVIFSDGLVTAANLTASLAVRQGESDAALRAGSTAWTVNQQLVASEGAKSKWAALRPWVAVQYGLALQQAGRNARRAAGAARSGRTLAGAGRREPEGGHGAAFDAALGAGAPGAGARATGAAAARARAGQRAGGPGDTGAGAGRRAARRRHAAAAGRAADAARRPAAGRR